MSKRINGTGTVYKLSDVKGMQNETENNNFSTDKRSGGTSLNDMRRKGSINDPTYDENKGDDERNKLK